MSTNAALARIEGLTVDWLDDLQRQHRHAAVPLPERMLPELGRFFPVATLRRARIAFLPLIPSPPFLREILAAGVPTDALEERGAFTVGDTVLMNLSRISGTDGGTSGAIFHELVHVQQFLTLGTRRFVHDYIDGLVATRNMRLVPLELVAYSAEAMYLDAPDNPFSVDAMVRREM